MEIQSQRNPTDPPHLSSQILRGFDWKGLRCLRMHHRKYSSSSFLTFFFAISTMSNKRWFPKQWGLYMMNIVGDYPLNSSVALIVFEVLKQFLNFLLKDVEDIFISCFRIFKHTSGEMSFLESGTIRLHYLLITREGYDDLCLTIFSHQTQEFRFCLFHKLWG